jgi:transposase
VLTDRKHISIEPIRKTGILIDEPKGIDWDWLSIDGAMTRAPLGEKTTGSNPTDLGKASVKRSVLTEGHGMPIEVAIDGANRHDMKLVRATIASIVVARPAPTEERPQGMGLDKGTDDEDVCEFSFTAHIRSHGKEAREIAREAGKRTRRWTVPCRQRWLNRFRRVLICWEKKPEHFLAFHHFACVVIALRAAGLFG